MFSKPSLHFLDLHGRLRRAVEASCSDAYPNLELITLKSLAGDLWNEHPAPKLTSSVVDDAGVKQRAFHARRGSRCGLWMDTQDLREELTHVKRPFSCSIPYYNAQIGYHTQGSQPKMIIARQSIMKRRHTQAVTLRVARCF